MLPTKYQNPFSQGPLNHILLYERDETHRAKKRVGRLDEVVDPDSYANYDLFSD